MRIVERNAMATQLCARLADKDADYKRFGIAKKPSFKEDGMRTHGGKGTFEWWYTDVTFEDGTAVVVIFFTKNYFDTPGPAWPTADFEIVDPSGKRTNVWTRGKKGTKINAARDVCNVSIEKNYIRYVDGVYKVHYEDHGIVYDATMKPKLPMWRPGAAHWIFGEGTPNERTYGWFVAQPDAEVEATLTMNGKTQHFKKGQGYHDHNWGNVSLEKILNHWYWGRAHVGPYTVIACDIIAEKQYGYKRLPVFMLARDGEILSDDPRKTTIERGGTHIHPVSGKFMDDDLTYIQRESGDVQYIVTFHREGDYNQRSILEVVPAWKRVLAKAIGMNPTYIRVKGTVGVEERRCGVRDAYKAQGLWEQYFMGSNKLAIIEGKTVPLSDDTAK